MRSRTGVALALMCLVALLPLPSLAGSPAIDPATLAASMPAEIDGVPVEASGQDGPAWLALVFPDAAGTAAAEALDAALADGGASLESLAVVDLYVAVGDTSFAVGEGFVAPGVAPGTLLEVVLPLFLEGLDGADRSMQEMAGRSVEVVNVGPIDPAVGPALVAFATDEMAWIAWGTDPLLPALIAAVSTAAALPEASAAPPPATAVEAILADAAAGILDADTALRYRVYALTDDPKLPPSYAALPPGEDASVLNEAAARFEDLPPELAAEVAPLVVRPTDPRSLFHGGGAVEAGRVQALALRAGGRGPDPRLAQSACPPDGWARLASSSIPVVVWAHCAGGVGDAGMAAAVAIMEGLWPAMTTLMGPPIPDRGEPRDGGDASIDIYLLDATEGRAGRFLDLDGGSLAATRPAAPFTAGPASTSSGYILLDRARVVAGGPVIRSHAAHELFHVLQYAHNVGVTWRQPRVHWFVEASATWAEHHFVPQARRQVIDPWLAAFQAQRPSGLASSFGKDPYSAFLWPLFMEQEAGPGAIARAWRAMEGVSDDAALDLAIDSVVSFKGSFRDFAVRAWNEPMPRTDGSDAIAPRFQALDPALPAVHPGPIRLTSEELGTSRSSDPPITFDLRVAPLDMRYRQLSLPDDVRQLIVDFTGLRDGANLDVEALVHIAGTGWERRSLADGQTTFCRDIPEDDLDRIILVFADHHHRDRVDGRYTVRPLDESCHLWEGTMTGTLTWNREGFRGRAVATFAGLWRPADDGVDWCGETACTAHVPVGTVDWTWESTAPTVPRCSVSTRGSIPAGEVIVPFDQMLFVQPDGKGHVRYWGSGGILVPPQGCAGWNAGSAPDAFFGIDPPELGEPVMEGASPARPSCGGDAFWMEVGETSLRGSCWRHDETTYEHRFDWDLRRVGADAPG